MCWVDARSRAGLYGSLGRLLLQLTPSLLPAFASGMDLDVHRMVIAAAGCSETGCTVHHVTEVLDGGCVVV